MGFLTEKVEHGLACVPQLYGGIEPLLTKQANLEKSNCKGLYTIREYYKNNLTSMTSECRTLGVHGSKTLGPQLRSKGPCQGIGLVGGNPTKGMHTGEHTSSLSLDGDVPTGREDSHVPWGFRA